MKPLEDDYAIGMAYCENKIKTLMNSQTSESISCKLGQYYSLKYNTITAISKMTTITTSLVFNLQNWKSIMKFHFWWHLDDLRCLVSRYKNISKQKINKSDGWKQCFYHQWKYYTSASRNVAFFEPNILTDNAKLLDVWHVVAVNTA